MPSLRESGTTTSERTSASGLLASRAAQPITILGPWDSDPSNDILSYLAPAVSGMLGARVGDRVRLNEKEFVVEKIGSWTS